MGAATGRDRGRGRREGCRRPPGSDAWTRKRRSSSIERSGHVSYANCGLPYFVGGVIEDEDDLLLQTPERLFDRFRLDVRVSTEVIAIDPAGRRVTVRPTGGGPTERAPLRRARPQPRRGAGAATAARLRPSARACARSRTPSSSRTRPAGAARSAVVIGAGFVGLETAENLAHRGIADDRRRGGRPGADAARPRDGRPGGGGARGQRRGGRDGGGGGRGDRGRRGVGRRPRHRRRAGRRGHRRAARRAPGRDGRAGARAPRGDRGRP